MPNIYQIYEKFLILFKLKKEKEIKSEDSQEIYSASLFLGLVKDTDDSVDIKCLLPDVTKNSIEDIMILAEKYAELLAYLNTEHFNKYIYKILKDNQNKNKEDYKNIMLIDNIIHFWDIFYQLENKKTFQKYKKDQPLIKPSQAFLTTK